MPYLSLYRKYRPQQFAQVMGQEHVVHTLQNALRLGHVANGYLFCGTRGVAKTTIARIVAKCLNCIGPDGAYDQPQAEPCNRCEPCLSIQAGLNIDVVEMDAASNRSVSDIARLRESVQFGPMQSRYKVYIVDEAHQLSSDAKDAFLKTLEEPPANVVFVLATTEAHAIPITIASRCQQFDFRRGSVQQIADQCRRVLEREQPAAVMPEDALALVAQAAEGSYRDALSLLDQVLAYKRDGTIAAGDVAAALGTVESKTLDAVLRSVAAQDSASLFAQADDVYLQGKDVRQFLRALGARLRDALLVSTGAPADPRSDLRAVADSFSPASLVRMLELVTEAERQTRGSDQHRLLLELTLLKLAGAGSEAPPIQMGSNRSAPAPVSQRSRSDTAAGSRSAPEAEAGSSSSLDAPSISDGSSALDQRPATSAVPAAEMSERRAPVPDAAANAAVEANADAHATESETELGDAADSDESASSASDDSQAVLARLQGAWQEVIHHMQVRSPARAAVVKDAFPVALEGQVVVLEFASKGYKAMLENGKGRESVEKVLNKILKAPEGTYKVRPVNASRNSADPVSGNGAQAAENQASTAEPTRQPALQQQYTTATLTEQDDATPVLDEVISVFGGRIIDEGSY